MTSVPLADAAPTHRPGYDPSAEATARRVLPMLARERVLWLSTVGEAGVPHLVPTWFWWDGEALLLWSKPGAVKVRNIRANPSLMVAVGDADADFDVGLIEAEAQLLPGPSEVSGAFLLKYDAELRAAGIDPAAFRATYTQAIRVVPTRFLAWHGLGRAPVPRVRAVRIGRREVGANPGWLDRLANRLRGLGAPATAPLGI